VALLGGSSMKAFAIDGIPRCLEVSGTINVGYPAGHAGYVEGQPLPVKLRTLARSGLPFHVRDYQREAADIYYASGDAAAARRHRAAVRRGQDVVGIAAGQ
jgi:DNA excision repair protein ERCC-3